MRTSEPNTPHEKVSAFYEALAAGNVPAALNILGDTVEWHEAAGMPYQAADPYRGASQIAENVLARITTDIQDLSLNNRELLSLGASVLAIGSYTGTATRSGRTIDLPYAHVWTVDDGVVTEFRQYTDAGAFRAAIR